jgi:spermidine synthase
MVSERFTRAYLLGLAFTCGAAVMAVEMAGQRSLVPHFGSSTYVWTNVIGVILAALSLGYLAGGRIADRFPRPVVLVAIVAAAGVLCLGIPLLVHRFGEAMIPDGTTQEAAFRVVYLGSFLTVLLFFAPPVFLLAMVSPFIIRLLTREAGEVGRASGMVYGVSTVGSIAGTFLPTLWLIPALGTSKTLLAAAGFLTAFAAVGIALFAARRGRAAAALLVAWAATAALLAPSGIKGGPRTLAETESRYQYVRVYERGDAVVLSHNEGLETFQSFIIRGQALTGAAYYDYFNLVPLHFDPAVRPRLRVYVAGLAAGVVSRQLHHFFGETFRLEVDGAEIDPAVLEMGRRFFGLEGGGNRNLRADAADGRMFLEGAGEPYDVILVDAYADQMYVPFHLATVEFFRRARERLAPGGIVCMNVADFLPEGPVLRALRDTMAAVFRRVEQVKVPGGMNHLLYAARDGALSEETVRANLEAPSFLSRPEARELASIVRYALESRGTHFLRPDAEPFTDARAPVEALADRSFREARREMIRSLEATR